MDSKKRKLAEPPAVGSDGDDKNSTGRSSSADITEKRPRRIGPALPPSSEENGQSDEQGSESDSDDDFGPSLPPEGAGVSGDIDNKNFEPEPQELPIKEEGAPLQKNGGGRDSWMLQPPDSSDWSSRVDPTKLRNRKFQTGRSAKGSAGAQPVDGSWTETPEQKMNRLHNQVMGAVPPSASDNPAKKADESRSSEIMRERVKKYNEGTRDRTQSANLRKPSEEEDDPSKRAFDREKDMALSSRISHADRRKLMDKASDFGSRFTSGKFL